MRRLLINALVLPLALIAAAYAMLFNDLRATGISASGFLAHLYGASVEMEDSAVVTRSRFGPPLPDLSDTGLLASDIINAWSTWAKDHDLGPTAIAVIRPQGQVVSYALGTTADAPMALGTLSSTVTGLCMGQVLAEHDLPWTTTLGDITAQMAAIDIPVPEWSVDIPLSDLANFADHHMIDVASRDDARRIVGNLPQHRHYTRLALSDALPELTSGRAEVNRTHSAILGSVIEALTGQTYANACRLRLMAPAGITTATVTTAIGPYSSYAGWSMSAEDAARLVHHWFADHRPWVANPADFPLREGLGRRDFAMGYYIDGAAHQSLVARHARWCPRGSGRPLVGGLLLSDGRGVSVVALWEGCVSGRELEHIITDLLR